MDFQSFKRRDLQSLCKLNKLPANVTNASMAESLASLSTVEGLEELLRNLDSEIQGSPERSAVAKPSAARTSTRQRAVKEDLECSNLGTRTRCRTRTKAVEVTDTRKTPATRTTRKMASQQASIQKMDKDLQADFEADMEQSQDSESIVLPGGELQEVSEVVSGSIVENGQLSESQSEAQKEVNDGEVIDVDDCEKNKEEEDVVNDVEAENNEVSNDSKVDFHNLSRKDLQNLCKKNKIPANMTNAAMADALDSLELVEGLQEFVNGCDSQVPSSPVVSGITSSCARRSRTTQKITKEEPRSSKLITKSCRVSRRRITEETEQVKNDVSETPAPTTGRKAAEAGSALYQIQEKEDSEVHRCGIKAMEDLSMETSGVSSAPEFDSDISNCNNVENSKESEELISQVGENVVEEVFENAEVSEVFTDLVKVDVSPEVAINCTTQEEDLKSGSGVCELDNTDDVQQLENLDNVKADDQLSKEVGSEFSTEVDQSLSLEMNDESELRICNPEKVVITTETDAQTLENSVESDSDAVENEISEKSDSEATSQDDHLSMEVNVESKSEESRTEDSEATSQDDSLSTEVNVSETTSQDVRLSKEVNVESEFKSSHAEDEISVEDKSQATTDLAAEDSNAEDLISVEDKSQATTDLAGEDCNAEDLISNKFNFEATTDLSLRQLKKLYKERLKAAKLANEMQNLTLKDTAEEIKVQEDLQENIVESVNVESSIVVPQITPVVHVEESKERAGADAETEKLCDVDILLDNEVTPVDAVIGNINVVTCAPQFTPSKCSTGKTKKPMLTPTKSASKMSAGRKSILDDNKENIDSNIKSELGKIKIAVTENVDILSPLSMAKLKKDIKFLHQQSEKKKQALKSRSGNLLLSP